MAKVFLSFMNGISPEISNSVMPCFYESFIKGLEDAGNDVLVFHQWGMPYRPRSETEYDEIREALNDFSPDLVIAFNNYGPDYTKMCECPILLYEVDSPLYYDGIDRIKASPDRFTFLINQLESKKILIDKFGVKADRIQQVPFFTEVKSKKCFKDINISFVGSRFYGQSLHWHDFRCKNPSYEDAQKYRLVVEKLKKNPFQDAEELCAQYEELKLTTFDIKSLIMGLSTEKRVKILSSVADLGLALYGTDEWLHSRDSDIDLYLAYNPKKIYSLQQNQDLYNRSKVCLNVNHLQAVSGFSWRVCDIMASSGCLVSEESSNLKKYFPNVPIPMFTNKFDCRRQCERILESPTLQEDISESCQSEIEKKFRFKHVLPIIESSAGIRLFGVTNRKGSLSFVERKSFDFKIKKGGGKKRSRLAFHCLKLALCQIPGLACVFNQEKLFRRIAGFSSDNA